MAEDKKYEFVRPGVLSARIASRERQSALGRGLGVLLGAEKPPEEEEAPLIEEAPAASTAPAAPPPLATAAAPASPPLPKLDFQDMPESRPAGLGRGVLLGRINSQLKERSAQGMSALFKAMPEATEGSPADAAPAVVLPPTMPVESVSIPQTVLEGSSVVDVGGRKFPLAKDFLIVMMDVNLILPNPFVPLSHIDRAALDNLVESIRTHGFLRPLVVMPSSLGNVVGNQTYWLITGERSWQVARILGIERVPVRIQDVAPREAIQMVLADEWHLQHLPSMDRARLCHVLTEQMGMEVGEIAERLAIQRDLVDETLSLLDLDLNIQDALSNGHITEPAAITLAQVEDPGVRQELFKYTLRYRWNPVRIDRALRARLEHQSD